MKSLSRRALLRSIGIIGLASVANALEVEHLLAKVNPEAPPMPERWVGQPLGRVTGAYMNARAEPTLESDVNVQLVQDDVVRVRRVVEGQTVYANSALWLETSKGYLYASFVQPMWYHLPNPPQPITGEGRWAELTVPYTDAYWDPEVNEERFVDRLYYGCTFRLTDLVTGEDGKSWYKVKELYQSYYMRATHLRLIPDEELAPISPEVDPARKYLDVNLATQTLTAYEGRDNPVFTHLISSGLPGHETPEGTHYVFDKRASERMVGGTAAADDDSERYNLAGVPFVCYFTGNWVATHGCYWHNDYGNQRSHGCVNLPNYAARWVWRWTTPYGELSELVNRPETLADGTRVYVHY